MIGVVVGREDTDDPHAFGFSEVDESDDVIGRVHKETFATLSVSDCVHVVGHLTCEQIVLRKVAPGEPLSEPHPMGRHRRRLSSYAVPMSVGSIVVDGRLIPIPDGWMEGDVVVGVPPGRAVVIPKSAMTQAADAVHAAERARQSLTKARFDSIIEFYRQFAARLADDHVFASIARANEEDVAGAKARGRATGRLHLDAAMRAAMVGAVDISSRQGDARDQMLEHVVHPGWMVEIRRAPLGVVGFVFEGRPNVLTDATGVLSGGNTCVFRIGRDALGTARAIMEVAVRPSLEQAGLPSDAIVLLDDPSHESALALMAQRGVGLAVARGSGSAVRDLGAVARQFGVPVSLHGTGGAWMIVCGDADPSRVRAVVEHSLDRKVCNTLNVVCLVGARASEFAPHVAEGAVAAARARSTTPVVHLLSGVNPSWFEGCDVRSDADDILGTEWEWDDRPELTVFVRKELTEALDAFNRWSPRFVVSVLTGSEEQFSECWERLDAPFVGDGMTRWVDGQYALGRPELGLSNWEDGRLLGRGAILSGRDVASIRYRARQSDPDLHR